jgi:hypothetical protein
MRIPVFQEPPLASNRPAADAKDAIGSVPVIERAVCESSHLGAAVPSTLRRVTICTLSRGPDAWLKPLDEICAASTQVRSGEVRVSARFTGADPRARTWAEAGGPVAGVCKLASFQRQTPAADAFGEPKLETLELGDALIDPRRPRARETRPVAAGRRAVRRQLDKFRADLVERQPHPLGENDERDPSEHGPRVATVTRAGPFGRDQPSLLVEAERRSRCAARPRRS